MHSATNLSFLYHFAVALIPDVFKQTSQQPYLDLRVQDHMVFKLTHLHVLDRFQFDFGHIVFVHVEKNVLYHYYTQFLVSPQPVESLHELVVRLL